jgi:AcrR family transcriptional regulator
VFNTNVQGGRRRGVAAAVSRDRIIEVADELARREGLANVTVRRVSAALGVTPAALYWHLDGKRDLLSALVDRASSRTERPGPTFGHWIDRLVCFYLSTRQEFTAYQGLSRALMAVEPSDATMQNCLYVYELLVEVGFDDTAAVDLFDALNTLSWGHLMMLDMARSSATEVRAQAVANYAEWVRGVLEKSPEYAVFVRSLTDFDDARSRRQLVNGIEMLTRAAANDAGIDVPTTTRYAHTT